VPALLAAADVLCLPSHQEAFGNVVLEAAAAGVPVVTSAAVAAAELFADAPLAGERVADPSDAAALGGAIARVVREDWPARSAAARAVAERHPWWRHREPETFFARSPVAADVDFRLADVRRPEGRCGCRGRTFDLRRSRADSTPIG
jgi:hypothetical protein